MQVGIFGTGGMACLFAGYLAPLVDVVLVGSWQAQLHVLSQRGLRIEGATERVVAPLLATDDLTAVPPLDLALILVKSGQTTRSAQQAKQVLKPNGLALTLQNGLGNWEQLTAVLPPSILCTLGTTAQGATVVEAGRIRHAGHGPTHIAVQPETTARWQPIAQLFETAGLETHLSDKVDSLLWGKLVINTAINPLTALLRQPNGFLATDPIAKQVMMAVAEETAVVAHTLNIPLPYPSASERALQVAEATAQNYSSMLQDTLRGVPTEIEAICGVVVQYGEKIGVATPLNHLLWRWVQEKKQIEPRTLLTLLESNVSKND